MYFEEKLINGWWYFRGSPDDDWQRMNAEQLNSRLSYYSREVQRLRDEIGQLERANETLKSVIQDAY